MISVLVVYQEGFHAARVESVLEGLGRQPVRLRACRWEGDAPTCPVIEPGILGLIEDIDCTVIAGLPLHVLSGIAGLDDSHPLAAIVIYCLAAGKKVVAVKEGIDPRAYLPAENLPKWRMAQRLDERMRELEALGVVLVAEGDLGPVVTGTRRRIVTLQDIRQADARGEALADDRQGVLTPLARDWMRDNMPHGDRG